MATSLINEHMEQFELKILIENHGNTYPPDISPTDISQRQFPKKHFPTDRHFPERTLIWRTFPRLYIYCFLM